MADALAGAEKRQLLGLARAALGAAVGQQPQPEVDELQLAPALLCPGACFVTLLRCGSLRGCIGGLEAERPLYQEVCLRAAQAALSDYRFLPVSAAELPELEIEISVLTPPRRLDYASAADLPGRLRPGVDGVILRQGIYRATFLPQVWSRAQQPEQFLSLLCEKLGVATDAWRRKKMDVWVYQVEQFSESEFKAQSGIDQAVSLPRD